MAARIIRALHSIGRMDAGAGGTTEVVGHLCEHLAKIDHLEVSLVSQTRFGQPDESLELPGVCAYFGRLQSWHIAKLGVPFRDVLLRAVSASSPSLFHDHGIWRFTNHHVAAISKQRSVPLIVQPHGMLQPGALVHRGLRKRLALHLYKLRDLQLARLFVVASQQEAESIRRLGLKQPLAVIPVGVNAPDHVDLAIDRRHSIGSSRRAVFLGRIHPIKGLLNLVEAWARVRPMNWRLRLAGPDEDGHLAVIMQRAQALGLGTSIEYVGTVHPRSKAEFLSEADLFILPSFSESFGLVIAEALAHGVPVITTRRTPWEGLVNNFCGWWIEPSVDALTETLSIALNLDSAVLRLMGERGRTLARRFHWPTIARQTAEVYRWVLDRGPQPKCVISD